LVFTTPTQTLAPGQTSQPITIQLQDGNGNPVAAASDMTITLSSSSLGGQLLDTSGNPLPKNSFGQYTITIPAGATSASFKYQDSQTGSPSISAVAPTSDGNAIATQQETVRYTLAFTTPSQVLAPNQTSGAITIQLQDGNGNAVAATNAVTINLISPGSSTAEFLDAVSGAPITSITIPAGANSASFKYQDSQGGFAFETISATTSDFSASAQQQEYVGVPLVIPTPPLTFKPGQPSPPITVQLENAATSDVTIDLSSSSSTGEFLDTSGNVLANPSITIPAGASSASFEYEDSQAGLPTITAQTSDHSESAQQQEDVGLSLVFTTPAQTLAAGQKSQPLTIQLQESNGNPFTAASNMLVSLTGGFQGFFDASGNPLTFSEVTIAAGSSSASFEVESAFAGTPTLTATTVPNGPGGLSLSAAQQETVTPAPFVPVIVSPTQKIVPGQPSQPITIQLQSPYGAYTATSDMTFNLSSDSSTGQFLDPVSGAPITSITIPAGANSAGFEYQDSQTGLPTLTASSGNGGSTLHQQEDVGVSLSFTTAAQTFSAGQTSQPITVQLQDSSGNPIAATSAVTVGVSSSQPVGSQFFDTSGNPLSFFGITIPAGSSSASFEYKSAWGGTPTLFARVSGLPLSATQQETINGLSSLVFTTPPATLAVGQTPQTSSLITVQLEDNNGNAAPAPSGGLTVNLGAFLGSGPATGLTFLDANGTPLPNPSLTIPAGSSTASFKFQYQTTVAGIPLAISAAVPNSPLAVSQFVTVQAGPPNFVAFSTSPQSVAAGVPTGSIVVSLHDQFGNLAEAGSGGVTINLSSSSTGGEFLSVSGDPLASPSVTIPQGASSATIEYVDSQAGTPILTAAANGLTSGTQTETITPVSAEIHVTNTNDGGDGSLRAAITAANASPGSTIVFDAGVTGTIDLLSALPAITASTNILGPGANVLTVERSAAATGTFGGFVVGTAPTSIIPPPEPAVILSDLTVANFDDTGIVNYGSLNLRQVDVRNNNASGRNLPPFGDPGGILNEALRGYLTVLDSTISNNSTSNSQVAAGIDSEVGSVTIINSTIRSNVDNGSNSAGGIGILGGSVYIANSTISGNTGTQQTGTPNNSGGGIDVSSLSSLLGGTASVTLYDTIVAGNTGSVNNPTDVSGSFISLGHNLIGEANSQSSGFVSSDQVGTTTNPINPLLGPLTANGGPTPTMALLTGSPAIGAGSSANAPATDQRGDPRPTSGALDIGAFELTTPSSNSLSLSPSSLPPGAVGAAYNQTITASGGSGSVTLTTSGSLPRGLAFTLNGNQVTISGRTRTSGTFKFSVTATDSVGDTVTQNYTLTINVPTPINLKPTKLPAGRVGSAYNQSVTAGGGVGTLTVTYQIVSNSTLGLTFNVNGGELDITGTPTAAGTVTFLVTATDPDGDITTHRYNLRIRR
jgi:hypothetical protein